MEELQGQGSWKDQIWKTFIVTGFMSPVFQIPDWLIQTEEDEISGCKAKRSHIRADELV